MLEAITYVGIDEKRPDPEQDKGKRVIPGGVVKLITGSRSSPWSCSAIGLGQQAHVTTSHSANARVRSRR